MYAAFAHSKSRIFFSDDISGASLVEDPNGGVLLVGGIDDKQNVLDSILRLPASSSRSWSETPIKLKKPRFGHLAFFVPNIANCRKV